jgi:glyoxylase-like metal-dependent hydrolase (beta-lactamase superfamily II)
MRQWTIGDVTITKFEELTFEGLDDFLPDATPDKVLPIEWLKPHFITPEGALKFSIHALVVDAPDCRIIVDTCVGNDKPREFFPDWHMLQTNFLEKLESAGYPADSFDVVLCTHLHLDHVGWNTMLVGDKWVPTFPNARHLIEKTEFDLVAGDQDDDGIAEWLRDMNKTVMEDSITPIVEAGLVELVSNDKQVCDEVRLIPTPGHTIGHVSVEIASKGEKALITGDFVHNPCQLAHPEWAISTDYDQTQSTQTRFTQFSALADTPVLVIGTHWPEPTAGQVVSDGDTWRLDYEN